MAQLVAQQTLNLRVAGSIPVTRIHSGMAQQVAHQIVNLRVVGSSPTAGANSEGVPLPSFHGTPENYTSELAYANRAGRACFSALKY